MGDRLAGGQLSASLKRNERGDRVFVNAAQFQGLVVDVSVEDARAFAYGLLDLIGDEGVP